MLTIFVLFPFLIHLVISNKNDELFMLISQKQNKSLEKQPLKWALFPSMKLTEKVRAFNNLSEKAIFFYFFDEYPKDILFYSRKIKGNPEIFSYFTANFYIDIKNPSLEDFFKFFFQGVTKSAVVVNQFTSFSLSVTLNNVKRKPLNLIIVYCHSTSNCSHSISWSKGNTLPFLYNEEKFATLINRITFT